MSGSVALFVARRFLHAIPLLVTIIVLNFTLVNLAPGDPIYIIAAGEILSEQYEQELRAQFGLDKPIWLRLTTYLGEVARGNLGYSMYFKRPVRELIFARLGPTLVLMLPQFVLSALLGVWLGIVSATNQGKWCDVLGTTFSLLAYSLPIFWLGQLCVGFFAVQLGWLPAGGMFSLREEFVGISRLLDIGRHLLLPTLVLAISNLALATRLMRTSLLEVLPLYYVRTARAKGLAERVVIYRHATRNALLPVVTALGLNFGFLISGAVLTETVFSWPGAGRLMLQSIQFRDYPVMMGLLLIVSVSVIVANLVTDLFYAIIDPRIRQA